MRSSALIYVLVGLGLLAGLLEAQVGGASKPEARVYKQRRLNAAVTVGTGIVAPGGSVDLVVRIDMAGDFHIYSVHKKTEVSEPTELIVDEHASIVGVGEVIEPEPEHHLDEYTETYYHEGTFTLRRKLEIAKDAKPGRIDVGGRLTYMACNADGCDAPEEVVFRMPLVIQEEGIDTLENAGALVPITKLSEQLTWIEESLDTVLERIARLERAVTPPPPPLPPTPPEWSPSGVTLELEAGGIRAGQKRMLQVRFSTPVPTEVGSHDEVFVDFGESDRVLGIEAVSSRTLDGGMEHEVVLEIEGTQLARSGSEEIGIEIALPLSVGGESFEIELPKTATTLEFGLPSLWAWVWKAVAAALLALLTPCVFPMIPVTVSFFTKQAENKELNPLWLPTVYVVGIILSFVTIGTLFTLAFGANGANVLATNGYLQGFFGLVFVLFAASLFGMFALRPPAFLMKSAGAVQGREGVGATLAMGLLFSLTSFTCTAPLVGLVLVDAAESGEWQFPIIGMFAFATVLALPFFFLAIFPKFMQGLPKSGGWLNDVKVTLGFLELAFAFKFIGAMDAYFAWGFFTREAILWIWVVLFVMNGLYLLQLIRFSHDGPPQRVGGLVGTVAVVMILFGLFLVKGTEGRAMPYLVESLMPPSLEHKSDGGQLGWNNRMENDLPGAKALARELGVPLFIDFTGYT